MVEVYDKLYFVYVYQYLMFYTQIKNIFITKKIMVEVYDKLYFVCVYQYLMFCRVQHHLYTNKKK